MPRLPSVTGRQAVNAFQKAGFNVVRIEGSHHVMKKDGHRFLLTVPVHGRKPIATGTLRSLIKASGLTVGQFINNL
jgi:predicted RNA binding protein YcfA (HicA-like mRNA interferase family)